MAIRQRNVAYKLWINQLLQHDYINNQNDDSFSYLNINSLQVARVNIIANIIHMSKNEGYSSAIIDDGSAAIRIKAWQHDTSLLTPINLGDIVLVIGRMREYNNERYILPELIRKLDNPNWLILRHLELLKEHPDGRHPIKKENAQMISLAHEEMIKDSPPARVPLRIRQKIISAIDSLNSADGVSIDELTMSSNLPKNEIELAVFELVKEGSLYEHKQGKLKLLQ